MATGYEVGMYRDIGRIAKSLEAIAELLRRAEAREIEADDA